MQMPERRYFRPRSLSWWTGVFSIAVGVLSIIHRESRELGDIGMLLMLLTGGTSASPAMLIATGMSIIGIREKLEGQ